MHPEVPDNFSPTAKSLKEDIVRGLKIGADDYITKPFDPEVLILRINNILKKGLYIEVMMSLKYPGHSIEI